MSKLRHTTCIWWTPYQSQHFPIQIASTTHFLVNSPLDQSPHIAYTRLPKLRPYTTVQYIHHYTLLQKHAKTASICKCPPYQPLHIPIQTCKKIPSVHHINHYTFPMQTCKKFPSVQHINHYANKPKLLPSHTFLTQPCIASTSLVNRSLHCIFLMLICQIEVIS